MSVQHGSSQGVVIQEVKTRELASSPATFPLLPTDAVLINQWPLAGVHSFQEFLFAFDCSIWAFWDLGLLVLSWNSPSQQGRRSPCIQMPASHTHVALKTHTWDLKAAIPERKPGSGHVCSCFPLPITIPTLFFSPEKFISDLANHCHFFRENLGIFHKVNRYFFFLPKTHFQES